MCEYCYLFFKKEPGKCIMIIHIILKLLAVYLGFFLL